MFFYYFNNINKILSLPLLTLIRAPYRLVILLIKVWTPFVTCWHSYLQAVKRLQQLRSPSFLLFFLLYSFPSLLYRLTTVAATESKCALFFERMYTHIFRCSVAFDIFFCSCIYHSARTRLGLNFHFSPFSSVLTANGI